MSEFNPYAPPTPGTEDGSARPRRKSRKSKRSDGSGCWQENGLVVLEKHSGELPERCIVCNRNTSYRLKKTFMWHPPGLYLLVLAGWLIYLIVAAFVRKSAVVHLGLCKEHQERRKNGLILGWAGAGTSLVVTMIGAGSDSAFLIVAGILGVGVFAIVGGRMARVASATKITDTLVLLKAGAPFVESLPESSDLED